VPPDLIARPSQDLRPIFLCQARQFTKSLLAQHLSDSCAEPLFHQSGDRIAEAQKNWVAMASVVEAAEDEGLIVDFIRHLWCSQFGVTREKELYDRIKERITSKQKAIDLSSIFANSARTYAAIVNTDNELWASYGSEARSYMATLNLLGMTQIRPLILSILQQFSPAEVKKSLRLFVSWAVRFVIVGGVGGGTLESHYSTRASEVTAGAIKTAAALLKDGRSCRATVILRPLSRLRLFRGILMLDTTSVCSNARRPGRRSQSLCQIRARSKLRWNTSCPRTQTRTGSTSIRRQRTDSING